MHKERRDDSFQFFTKIEVMGYAEVYGDQQSTPGTWKRTDAHVSLSFSTCTGNNLEIYSSALETASETL